MLNSIENKLEKFNQNCLSGSGQNYELYFDRLLGDIDFFLENTANIKEKKEIISIAKEKYSYVTPNERKLYDDSWKDDLCQHFFDPHCCPLGCGDI